LALHRLHGLRTATVKREYTIPDRVAYIPLNTYPEAAHDDAILGAISFAGALGCKVHVSTFAVDIPSVGSPLGGYLINVEGMSRAAEECSRAECKRPQSLVEKTGSPGLGVSVTSHEVVMGGAPSSAATEARYFDLSLVPWMAEAVATQDMAQSLVFGSGLPVILVPLTAATGSDFAKLGNPKRGRPKGRWYHTPRPAVCIRQLGLMPQPSERRSPQGARASGYRRV
jgi:hypothetical protein